MAQERNLGYASAPERQGDEPSKEELQRRMDQARDSIASTVTEIKDTVAHQVEHVKEVLDWREHFKKQPVAWSLGALGVGFFAGYGLAAAIKGDDGESDSRYDEDYVRSSSYEYSARPAVQSGYSEVGSKDHNGNAAAEDEGPSLLERFKETSAYDRLSREAGSLGDRFLDELSNTAHTVVLPALLNKIKDWIGLDLSNPQQSTAANTTSKTGGTSNRPERNSYEPVLERPT